MFYKKGQNNNESNTDKTNGNKSLHTVQKQCKQRGSSTYTVHGDKWKVI